MKFAENNQLTDEERGLYQSKRDIMLSERLVPVSRQSDETISSLVANLQLRPISLTRTTRYFKRRGAPSGSAPLSTTSPLSAHT